ncbi:MAG: hypothetical protein K9M51_01650 [Candidatus Gracilibacteria bacterium]|nr:hypothetical protein [Candidatus Gracilibacteria bacterium]
MSDLRPFEGAPDSLIRPETQTKDSREESRIKEQQSAAEGRVHEFNDWLEAADVGGSVLFDSQFENRVVDRLPFVMRTRIRNRIFEILAGSANDHVQELQQNNGEFSSIELAVWQNAGQNTLDAIAQRGRGAGTSLMVARGYEKMMNTALSQFESDWSQAKQTAEQTFQQFTWLERKLSFGRKNRFQKFTKKFEKKLEDRKKRLKTAIDIVQQRKKLDVRRAEAQVKHTFDSAGEGEKEVLWRYVREAVADPNTNTANALQQFTPPAIQIPDFWEALTNLRYVDGAVQARRSEALELDADQKIRDLQNRDIFMSTSPNYERLRTDLQALAVSPAEEEALSTEKMAGELEHAIQSIPGINFSEDVYSGANLNQIVPAEKISYFVGYLNANANKLQELDIEVRRKLLKYIKHLEKETKSDFDQKKRNTFETLDRELHQTIEEATKVYDAGGSPSLTDLTDIGATNPGPPQTPLLSSNDFAQIISRTENWLAENNRCLQEFEKGKINLPDDDVRRQMQEQWDRVKQFRDRVGELLPKWKQEREAFRKWIDEEAKIHTRRAELVAQIAVLTATISARQVTYDARIAAAGRGRDDAATAAGVQLSQAEQRLQQKIDERDALLNNLNVPAIYTDPRTLEGIRDQLNSDGVTWNTRGWKPTLSTMPPISPAPSLNTRIHNRIRKEFFTETEKNYLEFLEKNTTKQLELLENVPEGAQIRINFRNTTNASTLQVPQDLSQNREAIGGPGNQRLRVIRKNEEGILLEDRNNVYVIKGPSAKDGKATQNIGVYQKTTVNPDGSPAPSPGMGGRAAPPYSIAHSNPNKTGIILSLRIL